MKNNFYKIFAAVLFSISVYSVLEGTELEIQHRNSPIGIPNEIQTETSTFLQQKKLFFTLYKIILALKEAAKKQIAEYNIMLKKFYTLLVHMQQQQQDKMSILQEKNKNRVVELDSPVSMESKIGDFSIVPYNEHISETEKVNHEDILQQTTTEKDVSTESESNFLDLPTLFDEGSEYKNSLKDVPTPGERVQKHFTANPKIGFKENEEHTSSLKNVESQQNREASNPNEVDMQPTEIEQKDEEIIVEEQENSQAKEETPNKRFQDIVKKALEHKRESASPSISPSQSEQQAQTGSDKGAILEDVGDKTEEVGESIGKGLSEILNSVD